MMAAGCGKVEEPVSVDLSSRKNAGRRGHVEGYGVQHYEALHIQG